MYRFNNRPLPRQHVLPVTFGVFPEITGDCGDSILFCATLPGKANGWQPSLVLQFKMQSRVWVPGWSPEGEWRRLE